MIHFTDIHINCENLFKIGELELQPMTRFKKALVHADIKSEDLIVISGDLAAWDPAKEIYKEIKKELDEFHCEKLIIAGNHDSPQMINEFFSTPLVDNKNFGVLNWKDWNIYYLDSSAYEISKDQLLWLEKNWKDGKSLLFLHHPPHAMKPLWMDRNYSLKNRDDVWPILVKNKITPVFCGHYHNSVYLDKDGIEVYLTKSTLYQIEDEADGRIDIDEIAYREILLSDTREILTKEKVVQ